MKRPMGEGNGSSQFVVVQSDMGGWVRIHATGSYPPDLGLYLSHTLAEWFRQRPQLHLRCIVPIQADGMTTELHAWFDAHVFPALQEPQSEKKPE